MSPNESEPDTTADRAAIGRRRLLLGTGAAALVAGSLGVGSRASADTGVASHGSGESARKLDGTPVLAASIGSAAISGYVYRSVAMYDFRPFNPAAAATWGGFGLYSASAASTMRATIEIPAGALLRDVEMYVYNNGANAVSADAWLYTPGQGTIDSLGLGGGLSIPNNGTINAVRAVLPSTTWGPYAVGTVLLVGMSTPNDGTVQINGARVGFTHGGGSTGLFAAPHRVYDSRTTSKFGKGTTRTITLPADLIAPGVSGVILNVHALDATKNGYLKVYPGSASAPSASTMHFHDNGGAIADGITIPISSARQLKIYASEAANVIVDLLGTVN